jgi:hypothetical protein
VEVIIISIGDKGKSNCPEERRIQIVEITAGERLSLQCYEISFHTYKKVTHD